MRVDLPTDCPTKTTSWWFHWTNERANTVSRYACVLVQQSDDKLSDETEGASVDEDEEEDGFNGIAFLLGEVMVCWPSSDKEEGEVDETPSLHFMGMKVSGLESRRTCRS